MEDARIDNISIIQQHIVGAAEILINFTNRDSPDLFINGRDYDNGTVTLVCSFYSDDESSEFFEVIFEDVPESVGKLISSGLQFYWREKDQQCVLFVRFPNAEEEIGRIISEGKLKAWPEGATQCQ